MVDRPNNSFKVTKTQIIGKKFYVDFVMAKATLHFQSENSMQFTITEKDGKPYEEIEIVDIKLTEVRPNLYIATWKEKNKNTVTQIQDFNSEIIYSNWTLPNGEFINVKGTISPLNKIRDDEEY